MIDYQRKQMEEGVLSYYLPSNVYRFGGMGTSSPYMEIAAVTNMGNAYLLYFDLSVFPANKPNVYVERMLYDRNGRPMDGPSATNHTLNVHPTNRWTQICHYHPDAWTTGVSLWLVYMKCTLWLNMYEQTLKTGHDMDFYLRHMGENDI